MSERPPRDTPESWHACPRGAALAWGLWGIFAFAIMAAFLLASKPRCVNGAYRRAALAFLNDQPMYSEGQHGWLYPVQSAMLYIPFAFEPRILSELAWRTTGIAALGVGIWRLSALLSERRWKWGSELFFLMTVLTIPAAIGSAYNGQMNLLIAAMFVHGAVEIERRRWWWGTLWLVLALAAKPTSAPIVLVLTALHRPLWARMALGLAAVAAAPFLHPHWPYVLEQYKAGLAKVVEAGEPGAGTFADLTSLLRLVRAEPSFPVMTAIRAAGGAAVLGVCWIALGRLPRAIAVTAVLGLGAAYLMLFNPRTEGNTYVILAPAIAGVAAWCFMRSGVCARGIALAAACILLGFAHLLVPGGKDRVIRPAVALVFMGWAAAWAVRGERDQQISAETPVPEGEPA